MIRSALTLISATVLLATSCTPFEVSAQAQTQPTGSSVFSKMSAPPGGSKLKTRVEKRAMTWQEYKKAVTRQNTASKKKGLSAPSAMTAGGEGCMPESEANCLPPHSADIIYIDTMYEDSYSYEELPIHLEIEVLPPQQLEFQSTCLVTVSNGRGSEADVSCDEFANAQLDWMGIDKESRENLGGLVGEVTSLHRGKVSVATPKGFDKTNFFISGMAKLTNSFPKANSGDTAIVQYEDGCVQFTYFKNTTAHWVATDENSSCN